MSIRRVTPDEARRLMQTGAVLIDIRDPDEHARERIAEATLLPITEIARKPPVAAQAVIFHCRSGNRTQANADTLAAKERYLAERRANNQTLEHAANGAANAVTALTNQINDARSRADGLADDVKEVVAAATLAPQNEWLQAQLLAELLTPGSHARTRAIHRALSELTDALLVPRDHLDIARERAEAAIQEQLQSLMRGKTVIAIAHRLSTIAAMDRLVVLEAGRIVEEGTHAELLSRGGHYAQLWERQSGGFLDLETSKAAE